MERESFESEEIGRLLNDSFVPIKVDREERPDVDKVYVRAGACLRKQLWQPFCHRHLHNHMLQRRPTAPIS